MINKASLRKIARAKKQGKTLVLATGVFDLLHQEHLNFLKKAKQVGDFLIVGVEPDERVRKIKGSDRPIQAEMTRIVNLKKTGIADEIFLLPKNFSRQRHWENFVKILRPDVYAVSSHTQYLENKRAIMEKFGGTLKIVHQHNPEISTTSQLERQVLG